jgi:hypothetical protein
MAAKADRKKPLGEQQLLPLKELVCPEPLWRCLCHAESIPLLNFLYDISPIAWSDGNLGRCV